MAAKKLFLEMREELHLHLVAGLCKHLIFYMGRQHNIFTYIYIPQDQRDVVLFYKCGFKARQQVGTYVNTRAISDKIVMGSNK